MTKYYTGIGSRNTPPDMLSLMTAIAWKYNELGYRLRSGGAMGADTAFQLGSGKNCNIYVPLPHSYGTKQWQKWEGLAKEVCESFNLNLSSMKPFTQYLIIRNMPQVIGLDGEPLSERVVCWTPNGEMVGGTRYALRLAEMRNVPIFNLGLPNFRFEF